MTFVGHSLLGASLAQLTLPPQASARKQFAVLNIYVLLAFLPDLPLPGWGHARYYFSHSLIVNLGLVLPAAALAWYVLKRRRVARAPALVIGGALAWMSHLLLDALYNHGRGIAIYWPFSDGVLNLPLPWFRTLDMHQSMGSRDNLHVFLVEAVVYGILFLGVYGARRWWLRRAG